MRPSFRDALTKILAAVFGIAVVGGLIAWGIARDRTHNEDFPWKGTVARGAEAPRTTLDSKDFRTLEECRTWSKRRMDQLDLTNGNGAFSCGTGCEWKDDTIVGGKRVNEYACSEVVTE